MYIATKIINEEKNGVELYFNVLPLSGTKQAMKNAGFRWNRHKLCWYAKQSDKTNALADIYAETSVEEYQNLASQTNEEVVLITEQKQNAGSGSKSRPDPVNKDGVKVGDVFYDSWGYDQTNIDYYQVVGLKGTTQVVLRAIRAEAKQTGWLQSDVRPLKDQFITGSYITRQQENEDGMIRRTGNCMGHVTAGSGRNVLFQTTWDAWHSESSYA